MTRTRRLERLRLQAALDDPIVVLVLDAFPGSEVVEVVDTAAIPTPSEPTINRLQKGRRQ